TGLAGRGTLSPGTNLTTDEQPRRERREGTAAHLRAASYTAPDPVVGLAPPGHIIFWNPRAEQIFGWSRDEALGREMATLIVPERLRAEHTGGAPRALTL